MIMTYITLQDIRDQGLTQADYPDSEVLSAIDIWQAFLERACRQWFEPRDLILNVDGTDSDTLHFGVPIISINYIKINNDSAELNSSYYKVYNRLSDFTDRYNPRIKLANTTEYFDIYTAPMAARRMIFRKGRQNQEISGTFGFVESDLSTPKLIQRALLKLVIEKLTSKLYTPPGTISNGHAPPVLGNILEEWTDEHKIRYSNPIGNTRPIGYGFSGMTKDPEILTIIKLYKAPIGCATPTNPSYD